MEKTYYFPIFYLRIQEDNYLTSNAEFAKLEELLQPDWLPQSKLHSLLRTRREVRWHRGKQDHRWGAVSKLDIFLTLLGNLSHLFPKHAFLHTNCFPNMLLKDYFRFQVAFIAITPDNAIPFTCLLAETNIRQFALYFQGP